MPKPIVLSPHALLMMVERAIKLEWVEQVIAAPEVLVPDVKSAIRLCAFGRITDFGGRWLRVVYIETDDAIRVITAFFDRGMERRS